MPHWGDSTEYPFHGLQRNMKTKATFLKKYLKLSPYLEVCIYFSLTLKSLTVTFTFMNTKYLPTPGFVCYSCLSFINIVVVAAAVSLAVVDVDQQILS